MAQKDKTFTVGHNEFSDLTWEEFRAKYTGFKDRSNYLRSKDNTKRSVYKYQGLDIPDDVDWTTQGAVTDVKNQMECGSCWAFSTTGSVEGANAIASGTLVSLSEQMLVSCDTNDGGCNGGLMDNAFSWIEANGGLCSEDDYPYVSGSGASGTCDKTCSPVVTVTGYTDVDSGSEEALKEAVAAHPVSVAIEADQSAFQMYSGGVFSTTTCGTNLDHGVLAVGYGTMDGTPYWKVKNSWGESWGDNGYILMEYGVDMCGIALEPSYPTGVSTL